MLYYIITIPTTQAGGLITNLRYAALKIDKPAVHSLSPHEDAWEIPRMDVFCGQKLGGGQYGEVYRAEYKKYNETVAVKTLKVNSFLLIYYLNFESVSFRGLSSWFLIAAV